MQDVLQISASDRFEFLVGMIMAGLRIDSKVAPLEVSDLKGNSSKVDNDGVIIVKKIEVFLYEKYLLVEKKR